MVMNMPTKGGRVFLAVKRDASGFVSLLAKITVIVRFHTLMATM